MTHELVFAHPYYFCRYISNNVHPISNLSLLLVC